MPAVLLADPEHKTPIGNIGAVDDGAVGDMRRDQHHIPVSDRKSFLPDLDAQIQVNKKIKLILIMGMEFYFLNFNVIVVI